jgi:ADP-heptose:LPS heptosyltransferase
VERIAVLRGGGIGDLLFAVPAMQSLAAAYPGAEITLLGNRAPTGLLEGRPGAPHRTAVLPAVPGITAEPTAAVDPVPIERFTARQREARFDLAVQLHGGGRHSNPFLLRLGARHTVGTRTPDATALERNLDYAYYQHEVLRALEVVGLAGARPVAIAPRIALLEAELDAGRAVCGVDRPVVVIHPGASDPRRRWPPARFIEVIRGLVVEGVRVVLVGGMEDVESCGRILAAVRRESRPADAELVTTVAGSGCTGSATSSTRVRSAVAGTASTSPG